MGQADSNIGMEAEDACPHAAAVLWPAGESRAPCARPLCPWVHLVPCPYRFQSVSDLELSCSFPSGHQEPHYILMRRKSKPFSLELHKGTHLRKTTTSPHAQVPEDSAWAQVERQRALSFQPRTGGQNWASGPPGSHPSVAP